MDAKIKAQDALAKTVAALRAGKRRVVFTNGCFDILHVGHVAYLAKARAMGDVLVVGLNSDSSVRAIKGRGRPVNSQADRATVLAALSSVDYVTIFSEPTPAALIRKLKPDVLVKGADWKTGDIVGGDFVTSYGGQVKRISFVKGYSTTRTLKRMGS